MRETGVYYKNCLQRELARRCDKNPRYSMKALAKAMNLNAGSMSQYLSGKQVPSYKAAGKILECIPLSPDERDRFLSSLADTQKRRGLKRIGRAFRSMPTRPVPQDLSPDLFRAISDPIHYAILDSTSLDDFRPDPQWIASALGTTVTETKLAIERLFSLGMLEENEGRWRKATRHITTADKHLTNPALKKHQRLVLEAATRALENEPLERRSTNSLTLSANSDQLPKARKLIAKFMSDMTELLNEGPQTDVYQVSLSLFPITKNRKSGGLP